MKARYIVWAVLVLALAGLVGWRLYEHFAGGEEAGAAGKGGFATTVQSGPVVRGAIRDVGIFHGSLVARSEFTVSPRVDGRVRELLADLGDTVTNGQVIARLDDADLVQNMAEARASLDVAEAGIDEVRSALKLARQELARADELRGRKMVSESEFDAVQAQVDAQVAREKLAQAQAAQRRAALESARLKLSYAEVKAAWTGGGPTRRVGSRLASAGVNLRAGDPLLLLVDLDPIVAVFDVTEKDYARLQMGQAVSIVSEALPGRAFEGAVARVSPRFDEGSRQARVEVDVRNADALLKPGLFVSGLVEFARREDTLLAPLASLARRQGRPGLFVVDPDAATVRFVPVTPGIVSSNVVEILAPAVSGRVVTLGHHLLEDGSRIQEAGAARAAPGAGGGPAKGGGRPGGAGGRP